MCKNINRLILGFLGILESSRDLQSYDVIEPNKDAIGSIALIMIGDIVTIGEEIDDLRNIINNIINLSDGVKIQDLNTIISILNSSESELNTRKNEYYPYINAIRSNCKRLAVDLKELHSKNSNYWKNQVDKMSALLRSFEKKKIDNSNSKSLEDRVEQLEEIVRKLTNQVDHLEHKLRGPSTSGK